MSEEPPLDFSEIYEAYAARVRSYATKLIGPDEADDVTNEVFLKIARSMNTLSDRSRLASWVYAIALNTIRDFARRRTLRLSHVRDRQASTPGGGDGEDRLSDIVDPRARTPEEALARREMVACYLDYVNRLPVPYFEVYVLSEFEGLSSQETAVRLSLSISTVKIRLHRARARLFEELRRQCQGYYDERGRLMGEPKARGREPKV